MTTPYKSKFQESFNIDSFNSFLEKEVPGFGGGGPINLKKANEYYKQLIKTLEGYIDENNGKPLRLSGKFKQSNNQENVDILTKDLMGSGVGETTARETAIDFVSGPERREAAYDRMIYTGRDVLEKYEDNPDYDSIYPGT